MNFEKQFKNNFKDIINDYNLAFVEISQDTLSLVGDEFALVITIHFDNMYVEYVFKNNDNELLSYNISSYIASKFDKQDRKGVASPENVEETLLAILLIWSRGLPRHCDALLRGNRTWIKDYESFELAGTPKVLCSEEYKKIKEIL